jgi:hypothetical protein
MFTIDNSLQQQIQKQREKEFSQKKRNEETKRERDIEKERVCQIWGLKGVKTGRGQCQILM